MAKRRTKKPATEPQPSLGSDCGPVGRPRNAEATEAILQAAMEIAKESGVDALSMEGIAARAGVAKTTVYRRWPNVWAVLMDAFLAKMNRYSPIDQDGSARESTAIALKRLAKMFNGPTGVFVRALLGRAQEDADLREAFWARWVVPRRRLAGEVLRKGMASGELRADLDPDVAMDALYGAVYHRMQLGYEQIDDAYIDALVDSVFGGLEAQE